MIDDRIAVLNKLKNISENKMSNQWLDKDGGAVLTNCRKEDQTEFQFDMYELFKENMAGKTFYDNYNVEYEFHEYKKDGQEVCINKNYAPHCVFFIDWKDYVNDKYLTFHNEGEAIFLTRTTNDIYKGTYYPASVYSYINSDKEDMPYYNIDDDKTYYNENIGSNLESRKKYKAIIEQSIIDMQNLTPEDKTLRTEVLQLKSSQKVVNKNEEVAFTTIEKDTFNTEDYIFYADTGVVAPIAYLQIPTENTNREPLTSLPRYDYPSNHLSVVTEFTWINE